MKARDALYVDVHLRLVFDKNDLDDPSEWQWDYLLDPCEKVVVSQVSEMTTEDVDKYGLRVTPCPECDDIGYTFSVETRGPYVDFTWVNPCSRCHPEIKVLNGSEALVLARQAAQDLEEIHAASGSPEECLWNPCIEGCYIIPSPTKEDVSKEVNVANF